MFLSLNTERLEAHISILNQELAEIRELIVLFEKHSMNEQSNALCDLYTKQLCFLNEELEIILHRKKVLMYASSIVNETTRDLEKACMLSNEQLSKLSNDYSENFDR